MLKDHITERIVHYFKDEPTSSQRELFATLGQFILSDINRKVLIVKGYAGTGKTSAMAALVKALGEFQLNSIMLAPTGRAAKIISGYSGLPAYTIHKKIYRQRSSKDGFGNFVLNFNSQKNTLFIVDEASMISSNTNEGSMFGSGNLLRDLLDFVYNDRNCKLILIGDTAQLPPVGLSVSPALDKEYIASMGYNVDEVVLDQVVRQTSDSGILFNATELRKKMSDSTSEYPHLITKGFPDIVSINGADLIQEISDSYDRYGSEQTMVVCRSNKRANKFNAGIRSSILWREEQIGRDDYLMILKNNYFWLPENERMGFIANGDIVQVVRISKFYDRYGFQFVDATVRFIDYADYELDVKLLLNTLESESAALSYEDNKRLFYAVLEDYAHIPEKKKQYEAVRNDPFFNALQVKFAYAVTCHKAQGGQWKSVFIDQGYLTPEMLNTEFYRWLYTAFTRAVEKLYLVNFNNEFFE